MPLDQNKKKNIMMMLAQIGDEDANDDVNDHDLFYTFPTKSAFLRVFLPLSASTLISRMGSYKCTF
jgi:hypothetical protein